MARHGRCADAEAAGKLTGGCLVLREGREHAATWGRREGVEDPINVHYPILTDSLIMEICGESAVVARIAVLSAKLAGREPWHKERRGRADRYRWRIARAGSG